MILLPLTINNIEAKTINKKGILICIKLLNGIKPNKE
jgi:hypothetical protein